MEDMENEKFHIIIQSQNIQNKKSTKKKKMVDIVSDASLR